MVLRIPQVRSILLPGRIQVYGYSEMRDGFVKPASRPKRETHHAMRKRQSLRFLISFGNAQRLFGYVERRRKVAANDMNAPEPIKYADLVFDGHHRVQELASSRIDL